uniref:mevalonate kinase n=1 Tax=Streptomyces sp. NBC_00049 TaxID=2903617 RepID=A0AAU2K127_9ACTN
MRRTQGGERAAIRPPVPEARGAGIGTAHAKVILVGEHAAVYGAPAVALPVPALGCRVRAVRRDGADGPLAGFRFVDCPPGLPCGPPIPPPDQGQSPVPEGLRILTEAVLRLTTQRTQSVDVRVENGVPFGRGLGSSAACARALVNALDDLFGLDLSADAVFRYVQLSENAVHGAASGIDAWATGSSRPVLLANGQISSPPVGADSWIVVADSGTVSSTKDAVSMLREDFTHTPSRRTDFLDRSTRLTRQALLDLEAGRLQRLGRGLTNCHELLAGMKLTTDRTDRLVQEALEAGALGAKMSGGGLGGCVIALAPTAGAADLLAARLTTGQGVRCWTAPLTRGEHHARH